MASRGKKKTTMAKLARESRLRERRQEKKAKKDARRRTPLGEVAGDGQYPTPDPNGSGVSLPEAEAEADRP